ncbi:MAG TPA: hypothetical protein VNO32_50050, partial [Candidatus Acidoferrum sp.]|nr:hypothetical protein [Candidatus Acidoferrum sp.]
QSLSFLANALEDPEAELVWIGVDPRFDSIRNEKKFKTTVKTVSRVSPPMGTTFLLVQPASTNSTMARFSPSTLPNSQASKVVFYTTPSTPKSSKRRADFYFGF